MERFFKLISYIFHPLFFPLAGTIVYYIISPKYHPPSMLQSVISAVVILTVLIPIIFFFLLKNIGWIKSIYLEDINERRVPLYIYIFLIFIVIKRVVPPVLSIELYYYFIGVLGALIACLLLVFFKIKASMHMMGIAALFFFVLGLSFHYEVNITFGLAVLMFLSGMIASARLFLKAHTGIELALGFLIGGLPQFITFSYWL
ncbi:hypothetical protein [Leptobacterium sp. I13]|uniref:hypothetical protein n=1 Tax=Leptobacterium meishanense TaxID=3128904 RepID=UPI0030EC7C95